MKVAKLINNKYIIYSIYELFPYVSFPDVGVPESFLNENNLYKVVDAPEFDEKIQKLVILSEPVLKDNLIYTFEIINKSNEEIYNEKMQKVRLLRNQLLLESDIYVLSDKWDFYTNEQKIAWKNYRQELRDVPQFFSDLNDVLWPNKPSVNNN